MDSYSAPMHKIGLKIKILQQTMWISLLLLYVIMDFHLSVNVTDAIVIGSEQETARLAKLFSL